MKLEITCMYTCKSCGLTKVEVTVPARTTEDVVVWVQETANLLGRNHSTRNPHCRERKIDLYIPIPAGTDRVGGAPLN